MSDYYNELLSEAAVLKQNHKKTTHVYKVFFHLVISVIFTCLLCYVLACLNQKFDFFQIQNIGLQIVLLLFLCVGFLFSIFNSKNKSIQSILITVFAGCVSLISISYCDFGNLREIVLNILFLLSIFFILMLLARSKPLAQLILTLVVMSIVFILYLVNWFNCSSIFILELIIFVTSYIFYEIDRTSKLECFTLDNLTKRLYGHLVFLYTLFICACYVAL